MPALPAAPPPAAVAAPARQPVALWGEARQYMAPDQVQALYPQAVPTPDVALADGAVARLAYVAAVATGPAQVVFFFRGEELDAVTVQALEVKPGGLRGFGMAQKLEAALSQNLRRAPAPHPGRPRRLHRHQHPVDRPAAEGEPGL